MNEEKRNDYEGKIEKKTKNKTGEVQMTTGEDGTTQIPRILPKHYVYTCKIKEPDITMMQKPVITK